MSRYQELHVKRTEIKTKLLSMKSELRVIEQEIALLACPFGVGDKIGTETYGELVITEIKTHHFDEYLIVARKILKDKSLGVKTRKIYNYHEPFLVED